VLLSVGCSCSEGEAGTKRSAMPAQEADAIAASQVVESLEPGSPAGFDPAAWADAADQASVLPLGATLEVLDGATVVKGDQASVDALIATPGQSATRHWVFLHRVDGEWLVFGSLPLEVGS
jgi:hypothetical protein